MDTSTTVKEFIEKNFLYKKDKKSVSSDESLLDSGLIDSTAIFELVGYVESQFNIEVSDEDIVPENFESVNKIAHFISSKQKAH